MVALIATMMLTLAASAQAEPASVPEDARLDPIRANLDQIVRRAQAVGLPAEMIVSKVREGLAKGADPARIEAVAVRLSDNLTAAQQYLAAHRPGTAPAPLVRAVAEARLAGVAPLAIDPLVGARQADVPVQRAVEVMTDLSLRGYTAERATVVVQGVLSRDALSLDRVPGTLETIRRDCALTRNEAVDALARGLASSDSLQAAYDRTIEKERRRTRGSVAGPSDRDDESGPGKSGLAPGRLKGHGPPIGVPPGKPR